MPNPPSFPTSLLQESPLSCDYVQADPSLMGLTCAYPYKSIVMSYLYVITLCNVPKIIADIKLVPPFFFQEGALYILPLERSRLYSKS